MLNKKEELKVLLEDKNYDIVAITESWTHQEIINDELCIPGYHRPIRQDRTDTQHGRGGGVLLYIREEYTVSEDSSLQEFQYTNSVWCEITTAQNVPKLLFGVVYRSPNSSADNNKKLNDLIVKAALKDVIIVGDFNFPGIDWPTQLSDKHGEDFMDTIQDNFLVQYVDFPTRGNNCLDLILSNVPCIIENVTSIGCLGNSDHCMIDFDITAQADKQQVTGLIPDVKNANFHKLQNLLKDVDWEAEFQGKSASDMWCYMLKTLNRFTNICVPMKPRKNRNRPHWMTRNLLCDIRKKIKLWRRYSSMRDQQSYSNYKDQQRKVIREVKKAKILYEKNLVQHVKENSKAFFAYARSKQGQGKL
ncbi:uncharacterized protein [Ptychodera flava]|uniref:uncharacterized protein n=1 Tax=Ptychodera flava TaxID=63121 RepID=UPI003969F98E